MRKEPTLYNLIFPIWMGIFIPPFTLIPLLGNLLIDGSVIYFTLKRNVVVLDRRKLRKLILQAWVMGFVVDLIGVGLLFLLNNVMYIDFYVIWNDPKSIVVLAFIVAFCGTLIFFVNRWLAKHAGVNEETAFRVGLAMGLITAPYLFLVPTGYL
ncbi:MAG: hypothetical protein WBZ33_01145 [Thermoactinomyces sp.]